MTIPLRSMGIFFAMAALLLGGCATGERIHNVRPGMSQQEVEKILGEADTFKMAGDYLALKYINRVISGWNVNEKTDYVVILKNDQVVETGNGEVRIGQVGGVQTIFLYTY